MLSLLLLSSVVHAAETTITAPCLNDEEVTRGARLDLLSCKTLLATTPPQAKFVPSFNKYFADKINCYYQGYITLDESKKCQEGYPNKTPDGSAKKLVCSLNDDEDSKNHLNEGCGSPEAPDNNFGIWEERQMGGLWVQAVKYYRDQILNKEILSTRSLKVHSRCQPMADDYNRLSTDARNLSQNVTSGIQALPAEVASGEVNFCSATPQSLMVRVPSEGGGTQELDLSLSLPREAACFLAASRENRVLLFANLAKCELWDRVDDFMLTLVGNRADDLSRAVQECSDQGIAIGKKVGEEAGSKKAGIEAGLAAFRVCYGPRARNFFKNVVADLLPGKFTIEGGK